MNEPSPRYLRFLTSMVLGSAAAITPVVLTACDEDSPPRVDASPPDAEVPPDSWPVVDGPLAPPDLPRVARGEAPRYLRFLAALVLGSAAVVVPATLGGCDDDTSRIDAAPPDGGVGVDGPLHPPDLPRAIA